MSFPLARFLLVVPFIAAAHGSPLAANRTPMFAGLSSGGTVKSLLPLPDGRVIVSRDSGNFTNGSFTAPNPSRTTLCYVLTDGSFAPLGSDLITGIERPAVSGTVNVMLRLPDGKLLVGGNFTSINGHPSDRVARLHPDGSSDTTFSTGVGATGEVRTLAIDSVGRILVGGTFNQFSQIIGKNYLVRLGADGTLDPTFVSRANNAVSKVVTLPDGGFIATGEHQLPDFSYRHIARYDASGTFAVAYGPASRVGSVALNPAGDSLYVASSVAPYLSRVNPADGSVDASFVPGASAPTGVVENLAVQPDGRVLIYGNFTAPFNRLARYLPDGTLDPDFSPGTGLNVANTHFPLACDPAGRIWLGGNFTSYNSLAANRILVLDGDVPALAWSRQPLSLSAKARATVSFTAEARATAAITYQWQRNGSPLTASSHLSGVNSTTLTLVGVTAADEGNYTLAATAAGSDTITSEAAEFTFLGAPEILLAPTVSTREIGVSSTLNVVARGAGPLSYQWFSGTSSTPDVAIAGATAASFTLANPATTDTAYYSVRVTNSLGSFTTTPVLITYERRSGSQNPGDHPTFNGGSLTSAARVLSMFHLPGADGTLIGGDLGRAYAKNSTSSGSFTDFKHLARVLPNGDLDLTWPQPNFPVTALAADSAGNILAAGQFTQVGATTRPVFARYSAAGVLDATFSPAFSNVSATVNGLAVETSGNYLLGGTFNSLTGQSGTFPIIRITAAGAHDTTFNTAAYNALFTASARAVLALSDGKILVAPGNGSLKRLTTTGAQDFTFSYSGNPIGIIQTIRPIPDSTDFLLGGFSGIQRITANGASVFTKSSNGPIVSISLALPGQAFIAGNFSSFDGSPAGSYGSVLRISLANGAIDPTFITGASPNAGFNNEVFATALDATDRLWVGGRFTKYRGTKLSLTVPNATNGDPLTGLLAILGTNIITPPDPGAPIPDAYTAYLIAAGVPESQRGTAEDIDGDGSSNGDEFANSTNPAVPGDAKFTLTYNSNSFVRTPAGVAIPFTTNVGGIYTFTQPAGTLMRIGPNSFGGPNGTTFQGWAPSDFDSTLGYLPAITTTPLDLALTANRRLFPVLGYPLTQPLPGFLWRSGGNNLWVGSTAVFPPAGGTGQGTARSTDLETVGDEAWLETTVTAPGTLKFNWRLDVASGAGATLEAFAGATRLDFVDHSSAQNFNTVRTFAIAGNGATPIRFKLTRTLTSTLFAAKGQESAYLANFIYTPIDVFADYLAAAGVALGQRGPGADPDSDGVPNLIEFAFGSNPANPSALPQIYPSSGRSLGSAIQAAAPSAVLDPTQTYYTIQIRTPKNSNGVILTPEASGNLTDFGTGVTQLNAYGPPIDDGLFTIQSYYMTPGTAAAPTGSGFCRLRATR